MSTILTLALIGVFIFLAFKYVSRKSGGNTPTSGGGTTVDQSGNGTAPTTPIE